MDILIGLTITVAAFVAIVGLAEFLLSRIDAE